MKNLTCPECKETFQDGRGLHGHLRFKHDIYGEQLEKHMERAKEMARDRDEHEREARPQDPIMAAVERMARAKARKEAVEETAGGGLSWPRPTTWQKVKGECYERCKEEYEEAKEALEKAMEKECERRDASEDVNSDQGENSSSSWRDHKVL